MRVCWFSGGVSSFIAGYLVKKQVDEFIYCHIDEQHEDTLRFLHDCENAMERSIGKLQSPYKSVKNVIEQFRFINSRYGAKCSECLKKRVRKEWEYCKKDLTYIWGYDCTERHRAEQIKEKEPNHKHIFPLIDRGLTKKDCHGMLREIGIRRPAMYDLGYQNNNCIGCVKGGMWYWNKIRIDFPDVFELRARQEREIGKTCITEKINGQTVQVYLDELDPGRGRQADEIMGECGLVCQSYL
jgi:hypothetical protein